jgi:hypothetical protein
LERVTALGRRHTFLKVLPRVASHNEHTMARTSKEFLNV